MDISCWMIIWITIMETQDHSCGCRYWLNVFAKSITLMINKFYLGSNLNKYTNCSQAWTLFYYHLINFPKWTPSNFMTLLLNISQKGIFHYHFLMTPQIFAFLKRTIKTKILFLIIIFRNKCKILQSKKGL